MNHGFGAYSSGYCPGFSPGSLLPLVCDNQQTPRIGGKDMAKTLQEANIAIKNEQLILFPTISESRVLR
jgi:hypothetical protein